MGILILTPLLLTWRDRRIAQALFSSEPSRTFEKAMGLGVLILVSGLVFYSNLKSAAILYPLEYLPFPIVIWAALRFGMPHTALSNFILSAIAISGTAFDRGPFASIPASISSRAVQSRAAQEVLSLQAFIGVIAITTLIVAAVTAEHQRTNAEIQLTAERNQLLSEMALRIRKSLDLNAILDATVAEVRQFLQADRVFITHFDDAGRGSVVAESVAASWTTMLGWSVTDPAAQQEIQAIFEQEHIRVVNDTENAVSSPFIEQYRKQYHVRASIGVPIVIDMQSLSDKPKRPDADRSRIFGVLVVNQCSATRHWQPAEIDLMQQLGTQVAIAIQQAQLYQKVQSLNANLEQQVAERTFQLQENMAELKELNQFRDVLIHAVAHDLRTTVMGTLMVLKNLHHQPGEEIPIARTLLERMTQSGEIQLHKLNSLLEVYTYETEGVVLNGQMQALLPVVQSVIEELQPLFEQNQVKVEICWPEHLLAAWIDASQLERVFMHLLTNAVKHNPPGVTIVLSAESDTDLLRCTVTDNGKGIGPTQRDRLFELGLGDSGDRQLMGISLGLYFCRQIIEAHHGEIGMTCFSESGSTFWFTLPFSLGASELQAFQHNG